MSTHGAHWCLRRPLASVELMVHLGRRYTLKFLGIHQYDGIHGLPVAVVWVVHSCMFPGCICCCYTQPFCACTMGRCCVCILGRDVLAPWGGCARQKPTDGACTKPRLVQTTVFSFCYKTHEFSTHRLAQEGVWCMHQPAV